MQSIAVKLVENVNGTVYSFSGIKFSIVRIKMKKKTFLPQGMVLHSRKSIFVAYY